MKASLAAFALQLGVIASVHAGGASVLQLPIEGVTTENSDQCAKLFEEEFAPVLINWKNGDVKIIKNGASNLVVLRPERGQISLSDVEKALEGSPFTIERERLEYFSLVRVCIGKIADHEKYVRALATLDGKKLQTHVVENADGSLWVTLRDPTRNTTIPLVEKRKRALITHGRLTSFLSENKISLVAISWGHHRLDYSESYSETYGKSYSEVWRGESYGARLAAPGVERTERKR